MFTLSLQPLNISHLLLHSKRSRGVTEGILQPSYIFPLPSYLLLITMQVKIGRAKRNAHADFCLQARGIFVRSSDRY